MPLASSSSAANSGHSAADSRLRRSRPSSPKSVSVTGASMPAATDDAPQPGSPRSSTTTRSPLWTARHADASPAMPAPTTATSKVRFVSISLRRHYPDQVLAVGGQQPPSQPGRPRLPSSVMLVRDPRLRAAERSVGSPRDLVAVANDFALGRSDRTAIDRRDVAAAVSPDRHVEQRDQQPDDAHDQQDRADGRDRDAGDRRGHREAQNRSERDQEDGCPYPHCFSPLKIGYKVDVPPMTRGQTPQPGPC